MTIAAIALATLVSTNCPTFAEIEDILVDQAGENPMIASVTDSGSAVMFWVNPTTDTWTITETVGECTYIRTYGQGIMVIPMGEMA